jgi:hypothetical protein
LKAGSGKSTLVKFVSNHERTRRYLEAWANPAKLYTASYYFWNQGNEMQKSGLGPFQSLLYQIFREIPDLITLVCSDHLEHEAWDMESLAATFKRIGKQSTLEIRFCFFLDGLDEYAGEESDIVQMLDVIAEGSHIKLCVSSRPGRMYEEHLRRGSQGFDIANFTRDDMREYVHERLHSSTKFQKLAYQDQTLQNMSYPCQGLITDISQRARGVWLWVFLVTRELCSEAERDEPIESLLKVVDEFPPNLEGYFTHIIENIKPRHRDEMARAFLMMVEVSEPLPLYAFELLRNEMGNPNYALEAPLRPFTNQEFELQYPAWKSRLQSRCGDLVVVSKDQKYYGLFLQPHVEFLHRSAAEFLRDTYQHRLSELLKTPFDPLISLVRSFLCILKCLPSLLSRFHEFIIADMLKFIKDVEQRGIMLEEDSHFEILDEVSRVYPVRYSEFIIPFFTLTTVYYHDGKLDTLATAVSHGLHSYAISKVRLDPTLVQREGVPLLYYALGLTILFYRDLIDFPLVSLLLEKGADPNQTVENTGGKTVWELFLKKIRERSGMLKHTQLHNRVSLRDNRFPFCKALIRAGADPDLKILEEDEDEEDDDDDDNDNENEENVDEIKYRSVESIFEYVFSPEQAAELKRELEISREKREIRNKPQEKPSSSCVTM